MKLSRAIIILFLIVAFQVSFLRLESFFGIYPNLSLIASFILSYWLKEADILILALIAGVFIDLFSSVNFGASSLSLIIIFSANSLIRRKVLKEKTSSEFILSSLVTFLCYYPLLAALNSLLDLTIGGNSVFRLFDASMIKEVGLDIAIVFASYCIINFYQGRRYVHIWNTKRFTKISS